jgi:hypothetical protein
MIVAAGDAFGFLITVSLQHPRQIRAPRTARIIHIECNLLRALGGDCELNGRAGRAIRPGKTPESNHSQNEQENNEKASSEGHL